MPDENTLTILTGGQGPRQTFDGRPIVDGKPVFGRRSGLKTRRRIGDVPSSTLTLAAAAVAVPLILIAARASGPQPMPPIDLRGTIVLDAERA